jgi:hypothetical protein
MNALTLGPTYNVVVDSAIVFKFSTVRETIFCDDDWGIIIPLFYTDQDLAESPWDILENKLLEVAHRLRNHLQ